jgi:hypothetical protein
MVFFDPRVFNQTLSSQLFVASNSLTPNPMKRVPYGVLECNHTVYPHPYNTTGIKRIKLGMVQHRKYGEPLSQHSLLVKALRITSYTKDTEKLYDILDYPHKYVLTWHSFKRKNLHTYTTIYFSLCSIFIWETYAKMSILHIAKNKQFGFLSFVSFLLFHFNPSVPNFINPELFRNVLMNIKWSSSLLLVSNIGLEHKIRVNIFRNPVTDVTNLTTLYLASRWKYMLGGSLVTTAWSILRFWVTINFAKNILHHGVSEWVSK